MTNKTAVFRRVENLERTEIPDGLLITNGRTGFVHILNPTAAVVFELCDGETNAGDIAAFMKPAFDLPDVPWTDIAACLDRLLADGLIERRAA